MRSSSWLGVGFGLALILAHAPAARSAARTTLMAPVPSAERLVARAAQPDTAAPPESLSFLRFISICPARGCYLGPICPQDSITVNLGGSLPSTCYSVRKIDLWWPPYASIRPYAPWVRVLVDDGGCYRRICTPGPTPWSGSITIPPLYQGLYSLNVAVIQVSCTDSVPPPPWPFQSFPFEVATCDSVHTQCLTDGWDRSGTHGVCDATVGPGAPARLEFQIASNVALAGLQGAFELHPNVLKITNLEAVGAGAGMRLTWTPTDAGARFVMFSDGGAGFPRTPPDGSPVPVLRLTVSAPPGVSIPASTDVLVPELLGSDGNGGAVPRCPIIATVGDSSLLVYVPPARICAMPDCDFNRDGFTDVRDLVLMVHCLLPGSACTGVFDCDGNGQSNIDDVLCCAWNILRRPPCALPEGCPPDSSPPHTVPGVGVVVGVPVESGGETRVPIHIDGADAIGAARFAMSFPADRWRLVSLDSGDSRWLTLAGVEDGKIVMGAIRTGEVAVPPGLDLVLRLRPAGSAADGGELGALEADVSAPDGIKLIVPLDAPARPLPGGAMVELSENRPDPFSGWTRFTLSLPKAASVDLVVFDLGGRRIATLHHGPLAAGVTEFAWGGRSDRGERVQGGVYFYRLSMDGHSISRRMVFLGAR